MLIWGSLHLNVTGPSLQDLLFSRGGIHLWRPLFQIIRAEGGEHKVLPETGQWRGEVTAKDHGWVLGQISVEPSGVTARLGDPGTQEIGGMGPREPQT